MKENNKESFQDLFEKNRDGIYRFLLKITGNQDLSMDLTQDLFIKLHDSFHLYSPEKGDFRIWAITAAKNIYYNHLRKEKRIFGEAAIPAGIDSIQYKKEDHIAEMDRKIVLDEIKSAIGCLPEPEQSVLYYKLIEKKSLQEASEQLGVSVRTISRKTISAYGMLKKELKKRGIEL